MESPVVESRDVRAMTFAPDVMAASACVSWVESLPRAFSTMTSLAGTPARLSAFLMYGRSKSAQRTEEAVSGSRKATLPVPAAAMGFRADMVDRVLLKLKALAGTVGAVAADEVPAKPVNIVRPATAAAETLTTRFFRVIMFILPLLFAKRAGLGVGRSCSTPSPLCRT